MVSKGETLLFASAVKLYGRVVEGLEIKLDQARSELGANQFLRQQLDPTANSAAAPQLARIYGFSYAGRYTPLSRPALFLVHGGGTAIPTDAVTTDISGQADNRREFLSDIKVWEYDRGDFSLRLDLDSGPLERLLIDAEDRRDDAPPYFRGAHVRTRGPGE
jgi:hypothetical protein